MRILFLTATPSLRHLLREAKGLLDNATEFLECSDAHDMPDALRAFSPNLALIDLQTPGIHGTGWLMYFTKAAGEVPVLALGADPEGTHKALLCGVHSYLPPPITAERLANSLRAAHAGNAPMANAPNAHLLELTPQQVSVYERLVCGMTNKQIAWELGISVNTVKVHVARILRRLGMQSRIEVALLDSRLRELNVEVLSASGRTATIAAD